MDIIIALLILIAVVFFTKSLIVALIYIGAAILVVYLYRRFVSGTRR